jgi:hypothetical protein
LVAKKDVVNKMDRMQIIGHLKLMRIHGEKLDRSVVKKVLRGEDYFLGVSNLIEVLDHQAG